MARGELGYSKVRALTRIATPGDEPDLLEIGLHGTAQHVEKFVRLYRQARRAEETERADTRHRECALTFWHEDDGTVVVHGLFPPEMGARILSALDATMDAHAEEQPATAWEHEHTSPGVPRGTRPRSPACTVRRADVLAWLAERVFEPARAPPLSPYRHDVVVHVDAEVLAHRNAGRGEIEHRSAIAAETARRLCCDGGIVATVDGPRGEPLGVSRRRKLGRGVDEHRHSFRVRDLRHRGKGRPGTRLCDVEIAAAISGGIGAPLTRVAVPWITSLGYPMTIVDDSVPEPTEPLESWIEKAPAMTPPW